MKEDRARELAKAHGWYFVRDEEGSFRVISKLDPKNYKRLDRRQLEGADEREFIHRWLG